MSTSIIEVVNTSIYTPVTGAANFDVVFRTESNNQKLMIANGSNIVPAITLSNNFVGIGMTNPAYQLDLTGNQHIVGSLFMNTNTTNFTMDVQQAFVGSNGFRISAGQGQANAVLLAVDQFGGGNKFAILGDGRMTLVNTATINSNVNVGSNLYVNQNVTFSNTLSNLGNAYFASNLSILQTSTLSNTANVYGKLTCFSNAVFNSNVTVNSTLQVMGSNYLQVGSSTFIVDEYNSAGTDRWWKIAVLNTLGNGQYIAVTNLEGSRVDSYGYYPFIEFRPRAFAFNHRFLFSRIGVNNATNINVYSNVSTSNFEIYVKSTSFTIFKSTIRFAGTTIDVQPTLNNSWFSGTTPEASNASLVFMYSTASNQPFTYVDSSGSNYYGIGKSNPVYALDVNGDINFASGTLRSNGNPLTLGSQWTSSGSNIYIGLASNVGIGTSTPAYPIDVNGNINCSSNISAGNLGMFRNRVINGDMRIAQRGTSIVTGTGSGTSYCLDRFGIIYNITTGGLTQTQQTLTTSDTPYQYGFKYSYRVAASTANSSYSWIIPIQQIEGYNISDFNWGTTLGSSITVSFWARTNAGNNTIFALTLRNFAGSYSYNIPCTLTTSGTWQYFNFTISAPPNGSSWNIDNTSGLQIILAGYQSSSLSSSPNTWQNANLLGTTTCTNIYATLNNYVEFTGVQLEKGTIATPFEFRPYAIEYRLCQRYFQVIPGGSANYAGCPWSTGLQFSTTASRTFINLKENMRSNPSLYQFNNLSIATYNANTLGITSFNAVYSTESLVMADCIHASGGSAGSVCANYLSSNNGFISFTAEF